MNLCEEYLKRHSLDFPFVRYTRQGYLFVSDPAAFVRWAVLEIKWYEGGSHPGTYGVTLKRPIHNGYLKRDSRGNRLIFDFFYNKNGLPCLDWNGGWDQYEDFILKLALALPGRPITLPQEVALSVWEMFLIAHDGLISSCIHSDRIFPTIDSELEISERYTHLQAILKHLEFYESDVYNLWGEMLPNVANYSFWFGNLSECKNAEKAGISQKSLFGDAFN